MSESEAVKLLYRTSLPAFIRFAAREIRPNVPWLENWDREVIADALDLCIQGGRNRLMVNAPPLCLESVSTAVATAIFALAQHPSWTVVIIAGSREVASDLRDKSRALTQSPRFRDIFPRLRFNEVRRDLLLQQGGQLKFSSIGESDIGRSANMVITVDPMSPIDARDGRNRKVLRAYYDAEIRSRMGSSGVQIVFTQRLHQDDLVGHLLHGGETWTHVSLPAIAVEDETWPLSDGRVLTRKKGDPLHPKLQSRDDLRALLVAGGAINFAAQMQQAPLASESEKRTGVFMDPFNKANWTPEKGMPRKWFGSVPETEYLLHDLFGEPEPPQPARQVLTEEEWEQATILQQRRLLEAAQHPIRPGKDSGAAAARSHLQR